MSDAVEIRQGVVGELVLVEEPEQPDVPVGAHHCERLCSGKVLHARGDDGDIPVPGGSGGRPSGVGQVVLLSEEEDLVIAIVDS